MPKGPRGEKRPADVIGAAVLVGRIATGEAEEPEEQTQRRKAGTLGGKARALAMTPEQRAEVAHAAASARWKKGN